MNGVDQPNIYILAVDCETMYPDESPEWQKAMAGFKCPDKDGITLKGNLGEESDKPNASYFEFVIKSCQSMNLIRDDLGIAQITCADYNEIMTNLDTVSADLKIVNQFFDPKTYHDTGVTPIASQFRRNYLL